MKMIQYYNSNGNGAFVAHLYAQLKTGKEENFGDRSLLPLFSPKLLLDVNAEHDEENDQHNDSQAEGVRQQLFFYG